MRREYKGIVFVSDEEEIQMKFDNSLSNKAEIEKSFTELFKNDNEFVTILSGDWGIGKTHFWEDIAKDFSKDYVYISLFGKNSLNEIKQEILLTISDRACFADKIKKYSELGKVIGIDLSLFATFINKEYFKNIKICFDDIERISNQLELKDFMGFLSQLKEQNKCQIIVILNENELENLSQIDGKKYNEIFSLYKEKIVDYEFHYCPSIKECFEVVKNNIEYFNKDEIFDFFVKRKIKNIRVMRQCIYHLNKFTFIEESQLNKRIENKFLISALTAFTFKTIYNLPYKTFNEFLDYKKQFTQFTKEENKNKNKKFNSYAVNFESGIYYNEVDDILYKYLYSLNIYKEELEKFLKYENKKISYLEVKDKLIKLEEDWLYDLKLTKKEFGKKLEYILNKYKDNLFWVFNLEELKKNLDLIEDTSSTSREKLKKEILENYAKNILDIQDLEFIDKRNDIEKIEQMYPDLKKYIESYRNQYKREEELPNFFDKLIYESGVFINKKQEIIICNDKNEIKNKMIESSSFFNMIINIISNHGNESSLNCLIEIIEELKDENDEYKDKINKLENNFPTLELNFNKESSS